MVDLTFSASMQAVLGGALIGCAAVLLLLCNGRVAGVSGILGGVLMESMSVATWRYAFLGGLVVGGVLLSKFLPETAQIHISQSIPLVVGAGLLVGYGSRLGGGCTSGHGVCGIARLSPRSIVATITFIAAAMVTVYLMRHVF